jgi:ribosome-binding factor A
MNLQKCLSGVDNVNHTLVDLLDITTKKIDKDEGIDFELLYALEKIEYSKDLKQCNMFFEWFVKLNSDKSVIDLQDKTKKECMERFNNIDYRIQNSIKHYEIDKEKYENELKLLNNFRINIRKFYYSLHLIKEPPISNRKDKVI